MLYRAKMEVDRSQGVIYAAVVIAVQSSPGNRLLVHLFHLQYYAQNPGIAHVSTESRACIVLSQGQTLAVNDFYYSGVSELVIHNKEPKNT